VWLKMSRKASYKMSRITPRAGSRACSATLLFAALAVLVADRLSAATTHDKSKPAVLRHAYRHEDAYRRQSHVPTLPHGPEYGFLKHVPPNAIRMPGYIFVPGVGILGESCDLPTSACPNRYRDIQ
jgi:hypothetical protein